MSERKSGFERSVNNYIKSGKAMALLAESVTGINMPEETVRDWEQIMYAMRIVDDRIDGSQCDEERSNYRRQIMAFLRQEPACLGNDPVLEQTMANMRDICNRMGSPRKELLLSTSNKLLNVTERIRKTSDIDHFSFLTRLEGQIAIKLFLASLPEDYAKSSQFSRLFKVFTRFGRFANVFDTFADLPDDYKEGLAVINPSMPNRGRLLLSSLCDAGLVIRNLRPDLNLIRHIGVLAVATAENNPRH